MQDLDVPSICLGVANVLLILALIGSSLRSGAKISKLQLANSGLSHVLNATSAEYTALKQRVTWTSGGVPPKRTGPPTLPPRKPRFELPPPLDLTPPEGDDGETWEEDAHKTSFLDRQPLTDTQRIPISPELVEASRPEKNPPSESGTRPIPGSKRTGRT